MIIYKDKISTIEYDHVSQNITYSERGIANKELLLSQLRSVMEFSKTQTISSVIADFRNMRGSFKSIFDFLNEIYYPTLKSRGLICNAIVVSDDIINNHLANLLLEDLNEDIKLIEREIKKTIPDYKLHVVKNQDDFEEALNNILASPEVHTPSAYALLRYQKEFL